jgi:hypothetical protein
MSAADFFVDFIAFLFVLTISHSASKRLRSALRNGLSSSVRPPVSLRKTAREFTAMNPNRYVTSKQNIPRGYAGRFVKNFSEITKKPAIGWPVNTTGME